MPLLDVHRAPRPSGGKQHVGLAAQERGDLQDIHDLCRDGALAFGMHIREDGHAVRPPDRLQHFQTGIDAQTPAPRQRRAVGLVIACLEHELCPGVGAGVLHPAGDHLRMVFGFELAGPGDDRQRAIVADVERADAHLCHAVTCSLSIDAVSDSIR